MSLFSGMDKYGLGQYENTKVIVTRKAEVMQKLEVEEEPEKSQEEREQEMLFDKRFTCPVCDLQFTSKCIRIGKAKLVDKDTDLRPVYDGIDPLKYDVITCDKCGYSAITRYFGKLSTKQIKDIHEKISLKFKGMNNNVRLYSYDDAIARYKLALINCVVKHAKNSEKAYTSLKLGWIIRGKRLSMKSNLAAVKELYANEMECIKNAYEGFKAAFSGEQFPIANMDENTLEYIMADLARRLKRFDEASRLLGAVITSKNVSPRLKEQALTLKELIKEDINKNAAE